MVAINEQRLFFKDENEKEKTHVVIIVQRYEKVMISAWKSNH